MFRILQALRNRLMSPTIPASPDLPAAPPASPPPSSPDVPASKLKRYLLYIVLTVIASVVGALSQKYLGTRIEIVVPTPQTAEMQGLLPYDYEGCTIDGGAEHLHEAEPARWPTDRVTYGVDYSTLSHLNPPLSEEAVRSAFRLGAGWWTDGADLELVEVPYAQAMVPIRFQPIDGPGGVLAQAYLADGTSRPKPMVFDSRDRWTAGAPATNLVSLPTVFCHEFGHSLGLQHDAANAPAVMRPTYTAAIPRETARDYDRLIQLGYRRREKGPAAPADVLSVPAQIRTADILKALRDAGFTVQSPSP